MSRNINLIVSDCVDRLRQGVMCASNVGVSAWKRQPGTPGDGESFEEQLPIDMRATTICRDFDRIQEWAFDREVKSWNKTLVDEDKTH
jgi:Mycotoxin biosynthesis protein UstYa